MTAGTLNRYWTQVIIFLVAVIAVGGIVIWARYGGSQPIDIYTPPAEEIPAEIYIGGAVTNPGFYPLQAGDSIESLVQAAGGASDSADLGQLELYLTEAGAEARPQQVDLNRAQARLLQALPGIGEVRAQAIIDYRQHNGPFRNINELTKVDGIGTATYEQLKHLITVAD